MHLTAHATSSFMHVRALNKFGVPCIYFCFIFNVVRKDHLGGGEGRREWHKTHRMMKVTQT